MPIVPEPILSRFTYDGKDGTLYRIWLVNLLLKIVTLGVYSFWGKVRIRRYVIGSLSFLNDRLEYTGTGRELFRGFLMALPIIFVLYAPFIIWNAEQYPAVQLMFLPILFLVYVASFTSLRYKLSRITWRGVRGHLTGSALEYGVLRMLLLLLNIITLGLAIPYSDILVRKYLVEHAHFGSAKATFNGTASKLFGIHILTLLLAIPTLGFSRLWYRAALTRHTCESSAIGSIGFRNSQTGGNLLGLVAGNLLLWVLTFGFGLPLLIQRNMCFFVKHVALVGDIETSGIYQSSEVLGTSGEGMDGILGEQDIGFL